MSGQRGIARVAIALRRNGTEGGMSMIGYQSAQSCAVARAVGELHEPVGAHMHIHARSISHKQNRTCHQKNPAISARTADAVLVYIRLDYDNAERDTASSMHKT